MSWFFNTHTSYLTTRFTVFDEPPTLDIQMLNPLDEQRPLAQVAILGLIYVAVNFAQRTVGPALALGIAVAAHCSCPRP